MRDREKTSNGLNRRELLWGGICSGTALLSGGYAQNQKESSSISQRPFNRDNSPNILVFFCDQLRIDLLGCYSGKLVRTPNIDALAAESAVFERAYTPCAICSPARASLMTGLYPHRHHMFNNSTSGYSYCEHLRSDIEILPGWAAKNTPYETAYFGKWHIGPAQDLFNSPFHRTHPKPQDDPSLPFLGDSHWHPRDWWWKLVRPYGDGSAGTLDVPMDKFPDVAAANYTKRFIRGRGAKSRPFLVFCAFPGPHSPWLIPEEFGIRYDPSEIPMWQNRQDSFKKKPINQKKLRLFETIADDTLKELLACCFSYMELIDTMVGQVVSELKATGQYDNTVIVLTADHGDMAGAHGFLSKGSYMYDEIYRIPLLIKPTYKHVSTRISAPVNLMDLTATIMHVMKGEATDHMESHTLQGQSLIELVAGGNVGQRAVHYAEYHGDWYGLYSTRMVADGQWKLAWNFSDYGELYDLTSDPGELRNLFYEKANHDIRKHYFDILINEAKRLDDQQATFRKPDIENGVPLAFDSGFGMTSS